MTWISHALPFHFLQVFLCLSPNLKIMLHSFSPSDSLLGVSSLLGFTDDCFNRRGGVRVDCFFLPFMPYDENSALHTLSLLRDPQKFRLFPVSCEGGRPL